MFLSENSSSYELRTCCHQPVRLHSSCRLNSNVRIHRAGTLLVWRARHDLLSLSGSAFTVLTRRDEIYFRRFRSVPVPSAHVQCLTRTTPPASRPPPVTVGDSASGRPLLGFLSLRRSQCKAATHARASNSDCAAPSGFRNLSTLCSALYLAALFHAAAAHGIPSPELSLLRSGSHLSADLPHFVVPPQRVPRPESRCYWRPQPCGCSHRRSPCRRHRYDPTPAIAALLTFCPSGVFPPMVLDWPPRPVLAHWEVSRSVGFAPSPLLRPGVSTSSRPLRLHSPGPLHPHVVTFVIGVHPPLMRLGPSLDPMVRLRFRFAAPGRLVPALQSSLSSVCRTRPTSLR